MKVTFDSEIYLDEIFRRAVKLAAANRRKPFKLYSYLSDRKSKLSVGIDIQTYGPYNARMALLTTNEANPKEIDLERIEMFDDHVGNLKYDESFTSEQLEFVKEFKYLLGKCLECFGKRWNELRKDRELAMSKSVEFKLVEKDQFPFVYYDESRVYSVNSIMQRFFRAMFECLSIDTMCTAHLAHLKNVCVTVPSDYHTYQRLLLKNCLRSIGIESCIFVNKPTSLALPFLAKDLNDRTQKFVIDFSSGYMNCSIIQLIDTNRLLVQDQLSDKTISSRDFYLDCYKHLEQSSNKRHSNDKLYDPLKLNHELYKVMNEETNPRWNQTKEVWTVRCSKSTTVDLNMKRVGIEQFTSSVVNKLRRTRLIDVNDHIVDEIDDIFICSDAVVYEYLEPLLTRLSRANSKRSVRFMDNDCACLGAAYLASDLLGISTSDMLPYHIGVGLYNGLVKHIIPAKANFPCEDTHIFQTIIDNQTTIRANIYEGKSVLARNSKHICELSIEGLKSAPSGQVRIELKIYIDQNGVLSALACDYTTKKALRVSIDPNETEYLKFKRDHSLLVDLDQRIDSSSSLQANIIKYLEDFDYYFEYLTHLYGNSPYELRSKVTSRINAAKKYISRNRFRIGLDECEKLKSELDGVVLTNRAINPNDYSSSSSNGYSRASSVRRRSSDCIIS